MDWAPSIWIYFVLCLSTIVQGTRYEFFADDDDVFVNCADIPGNNGVHDAVDMSEFHIKFHEGVVSASGNMTCVWEGVEPTDRIDVR